MAVKHWTTRDGRRVRISEMTDSHLVNTLRFLKRQAVVWQSQYLLDGMSALSMLQGEMAIDSVESDMRRVEMMDDEDFLEAFAPAWLPLCEEAEKRGLNW